MASCTLIVYKDDPMPWAKLSLNDNNGHIYWEWIPLEQGGNMRSGYVEKSGNDYILIKRRNKKEFGTLVNFSLYNYHPEIIYVIKNKHTDKKGVLRCRIEQQFQPTF